MRLLKSALIITLALGLLVGLSVFVTRPAAQAAPLGTIQTWINNAPIGSTVIIPAGTYTESLTVNKTLTLTGVSSGTTSIQAVTGQRVITVTSGHDLRLENLTVTGGQTGDAGGGVYLISGSLKLVNCRIISNAAAYGGGVFQAGAGGRVEVIGSRIELNTTSNQGGGLYVTGNAAFTNTQVLSNTASWHGGGAHVQSGRVDVSGGVFGNNRAVNGNGGAINLNGSLSLSGTLIVSNTAINGGGVQQWNTAPTVLITTTRFERNTASSVGGGAAISGTFSISGSTFATNTVDSGNASSTFGGGVYAGIAGQIVASTFSGNSALCTYDGGSCSNADGGGLYDNGSNVTLTDVTFKANEADRMGGGMYSKFSSPVVTNAIFSGNKATFGGGLYHDRGSPRLTNVLFSGNEGGWAGGMLASQDNPILKHVTFSGNDGYNMGGALENFYGTPTIINSILWGNTAAKGPEIYNYDANSVITVTYSNIKFTGIYTGVGNINVDPRFVLPISYTAAPTTAGNYHLQAGSPAIDFGSNAGVTTDLDGRKRPLGNGYDMGAYEFQPHVYLPLILK